MMFDKEILWACYDMQGWSVYRSHCLLVKHKDGYGV